MSLKLVPVGAAIWANALQPLPEQRSSWYPVTPTLSVAAVQLTLTWLWLAATAASPPGALGGVVSGAAGVVAFTVLELPLTLPAPSTARTR